MAGLVIDNTVQVRLIWYQGTSPAAVNVLHGIKKTPFAGVDQGSVNALRAAIAATWPTATIKSEISSTYGIRDVTMRDLNSPNNVEFVATGAQLVGSSTADLLPLQTALCCTLRTSKAGASFRGRYYQSGYTEGFGSGGLASAGVTGALSEWVNRLKTAFSDTGLDMSVASRLLGISNKVESVVVRDASWDTQRRRATPGI